MGAGQSTSAAETVPRHRLRHHHQSISPPAQRLLHSPFPSPPPPPPLPRRSITPSIPRSPGQFAVSRRDSARWDGRSGRALFVWCGHVLRSDLRGESAAGSHYGQGSSTG
ncbi:hypothetical protein VPH35_122729 [Triticum aestivum]